MAIIYIYCIEVFSTTMSSITNMYICFFDGSEESKNNIIEGLKWLKDDWRVRIFKNRGCDENGVEDTIKAFYKDTEVISIEEWNDQELYSILENECRGHIINKKEYRIVIDISNANRIEAFICSSLYYVVDVEIICKIMNGIKPLENVSIVDLERFGRSKIAVLETLYEEKRPMTTDDVTNLIKEKRIGKNNGMISNKHVGSSLRDYIEMDLVKRITLDPSERQGRKTRFVYEITKNGKASVNKYRRMVKK